MSGLPESVRFFRSAPKVLSLAVLATLLLFLAGLFLSAAAVANTLDQAGDVARTEEQTAYHVAEISRGLSRLRANVVEAVTDPQAPASVRLGRAHLIEQRISQAMDELPALLGPEERAQWVSLRPQLDRLLEGMTETMALIEAGNDVAAETELDRLAPQFDEVYDDLRLFESVSIEDTQDAIMGIEARGTRTAWVAAGSAIAVIGAVGFAWLFILRIIAAQREELAAYVQRLEDSNRDLDAFAGRVAHDMRNVLEPIVLSADLLRSSEDPRNHKTADRIGRACKRGENLIAGLLAFARSTIDRTSPGSQERASIAHEVRGVLEHLQNKIEGTGVTVITHIPNDAFVAIAPILLNIVVNNVISNADKYMNGCPERRLEITATASDTHWTITVKDTGPGIPADAHARVFEPFFRARPGEPGGVGLGLATVKRIIDSHGGRVGLSSAEGQGTTIEVALSRVPPQLPHAATDPDLTPEPNPTNAPSPT